MGKFVAIKEYEVKKELTYNNTPLLKYSIKYPQFTSREFSRFAGRLNAFFSAKALAQARYCETELFGQAVEYFNEALKSDYPFHEYELQIDYAVTLNEGCLLSLYFDKGVYTGGANGTSVRSSYNWNMAASMPVNLDALYPYCNNYQAIIKAEVGRQISEQLKKDKGYFFDGWQKLADEYFDCNNFYLTSQALTVFFQEITIAPHSSGTVVFDIPYVTGPVKPTPCN